MRKVSNSNTCLVALKERRDHLAGDPRVIYNVPCPCTVKTSPVAIWLEPMADRYGMLRICTFSSIHIVRTRTYTHTHTHTHTCTEINRMSRENRGTHNNIRMLTAPSQKCVVPQLKRRHTQEKSHETATNGCGQHFLSYQNHTATLQQNRHFHTLRTGEN